MGKGRRARSTRELRRLTHPILSPNSLPPQLKAQTLKKYIDSYELPVRPDVNPNEMSIAVAR